MDALNTIWQAIKRTPGAFAGGGVDIANFGLGLLTGKGLSGFSPEPIGGSAWINKQFGMQPSTSAIQSGIEAALSSITPSGAAKALIVALPLKMAKEIGIANAAGAATDTLKKTGSQFLASEASARELKQVGNPEGIYSLFTGPDKALRAVVSNEHARLAPRAADYVKSNIFLNRAELGKKYKNTKDLAPGPEVPLSDILLHPHAYNLVPELATIQVRHSPLLDIFGSHGAYVPGANTIELAGNHYAPRKWINDPTSELVATLLHEMGHVGQAANSVRGGTAPSQQMLKKSLNEAVALGSYSSPETLAAIRNVLNNAVDGKLPDNIAEKLYRTNYGEWEAEAGANMLKNTFPLMYERGRTW